MPNSSGFIRLKTISIEKSTQSYDRGDQFTAYQSLPTFTEYLLIDQTRIQVEHRLRTAPNQWHLTVYSEPTDRITLSSLNTQQPIAFSIGDLYKKVSFETAIND